MNEKIRAKQESCKSCGLKPAHKKAAIIILGLLAIGLFYFLSNQTQSPPNLKLLTSHSSPQTGENWVVSFETTGKADLIITPEDEDSINDLDFVSLTCDGAGETETLQVLNGDIVFYSNWRCEWTGELTHLVNTARKHTLKFSFGNQSAFAYNNPDSVTDTFTDESKIAATSSVVVTGGQVKLAEVPLKGNGESCSSGDECESTFCVDGYCCNSACSGNCDRCNVGGSEGTCTDVNSDCAGTGASCYCSGGNCQACSNNDSSCECSGYTCQACTTCKTCSGYSCINRAIDSQPAGCTGCNWCDGNGVCKSCVYGSSSLQGFCIGVTTPILYCQPSRIGLYGYETTNNCTGYTRVSGGTSLNKCVRYTCTCP